MYSKLALFAASAFALGAMAAPGVPAPAGGNPPPPAPVSQCNTGTIRCCESVQDSTAPEAKSILSGLVNVLVGPVLGPVGINCLSVVGGNSCTAQNACCTGNHFEGLITIACSPINIGL